MKPAGEDGRRAKKRTGGIGLIFRGLNFLRNNDIEQIDHFRTDTNEAKTGFSD
jgi:hypothetical protein